MGLENGFKIREIDGKKWSRYSDMRDEIKEFTYDNKIDSKENDVLDKILDYNKKKNREKLVLNKSTKHDLEILKNILGINIEVKRKIQNILNLDNNNEKVDFNRSEYLLKKLENNKNKINGPITLGKSLTKNELILLQTIGKEKGYYNGRIDGITGKKSYRAYKKLLGLSSVNKVKNNTKVETNRSTIEINSRDLKDFAAMIKAEAGIESKTGKIAVANVILNRMKEGKSMRQVLYKRTRSGKSEFSPIDDGRLNKMKSSLTKSDYDIVNDVLNNKVANPIANATFFQNKQIEKKLNTWQERAEKRGKLKKVAIIGNHIFRAVV